MSHLTRRRNRGFILVTLIGLMLLAGVYSAAYFTLTNASQKQRRMREILIAQSLVVELLEYFVSQSVLQLRANFGTVPLCSYRNVLNRSDGTKFNPAALADPSANSLDAANAPSNRYFRIDVIDVRTRALKDCPVSGGPSATTVDSVARVAGETYQITVGVTWIDPKNPAASPRRLEMASITQNF